MSSRPFDPDERIALTRAGLARIAGDERPLALRDYLTPEGTVHVPAGELELRDERCRAGIDGYRCEREAGHAGNHQAVRDGLEALSVRLFGWDVFGRYTDANGAPTGRVGTCDADELPPAIMPAVVDELEHRHGEREACAGGCGVVGSAGFAGWRRAYVLDDPQTLGRVVIVCPQCSGAFQESIRRYLAGSRNLLRALGVEPHPGKGD